MSYPVGWRHAGVGTSDPVEIRWWMTDVLTSDDIIFIVFTVRIPTSQHL